MALSGGSSAARDMLLRGGSTKNAAIIGGENAMMEFATEKMGFDRIMGNLHAGKGGKFIDVFKQFMKGYIPEGLEEVPGGFVDALVDEYLMGKDSKRNQNIQAYMASGMTLDQAQTQADWDFISDEWNAFAQGGMAGGLMEAGAYGIGTASGKIDAAKQTRSIAKELPGVDTKAVRATLEMENGVREVDESVIKQASSSVRSEEAGATAKQVAAEMPGVNEVALRQVLEMDAGVREENAQTRQQVEAEIRQATLNKAMAKPFEAEATVEGGAVTATGFADNGQVNLSDGRSVALGSVRFADEDVQAAYQTAAAYPDVQTKRNYLAGYEASRLPNRVYSLAFDGVYQNGTNSRAGAETVLTRMLSPEVHQLVYKAGQAATVAQDVRMAIPEEIKGTVRKTLEAMPTEVSESYAGVVNKVRTTRITQAQAVQMALLDAYGKKHDVQYVVVDTMGGVEQGSFKGGRTINIALDADAGNLTRVASHEGWHYIKSWNAKEAVSLQNAVVSLLKKADGYDLEARVDEKIKQYSENGVRLDRDGALEEIVADSLFDAISTKENVAELFNEHRTLAEKLYDFAKRFVQEIKDMVKRIAGTNAEARAMQQYADMAETFIEEYDKLMVTANAKRAAGMKEEGRGSAKYKLSENLQQQFSQVEMKTEDERYVYGAGMYVNVGTTSEAMKSIGVKDQTIKFGYGKIRNILENPDHDMTMDIIRQVPELLENPIMIQESISEKEKTGSETCLVVYGTVYDEKGAPVIAILELEPTAGEGQSIQNFQVIKSAYGKTTNIQGLINKQKTYYTDPNKKRTLNWFAGTGLQLPVSQTNLGPIATVAYSEPIVKQKRRENNVEHPRTAVELAFEKGLAKKEAKERFSMKEPVEVTKDLVAVHNLTESDLMRTLEIGGFPMPSVAIVKAKDGHTPYGDISVVFGRDTIDPQSNAKNKVYGADAWTPTKPKTEYQVNGEKAFAAIRRLRTLAAQVSDYYDRSVSQMLSFAYDDETDLSTEQLVQKAVNDTGMMAAYLTDKGTPVERVVKYTEAKPDGWSEEHSADYAAFKQIMGADFQNAKSIPMIDLLAAHKDELVVAFPWMEPLYTNKGNVFRARMRFQNILNGALKYETKAMTKSEPFMDTHTMNNSMYKAIDKADFTRWVRKELDGIIGTAGIRNGKDPYTASGNKRSFQQTHYDYTLENIVKAMQESQSERGEGLVGATASGMRAVATKEFKSVDEMHKVSDRLSRVTQEQFHAAAENLENQIDEIINDVKRTNRAHSDNPFIESDAIGEVLINGAQSMTEAAVIRSMKKDGYTVSAELAQKILAMYDAAANLPTKYFESKPQRAVGLDEIKAVILPDSADGTLIAQLGERGVNVVEYAEGNEQERLDALNALEDVKFSLKDSAGRKLTQEQADFFDDSVVRDDDGNLLVVYHGTNADFTTFRRKYLGKNTDGNGGYLDETAKIGFWFSNHDTADAKTMPYKFTIYDKSMQVYLNMTDPWECQSVGHVQEAIDQNGGVKNFVSYMKQCGYDGIIVKNDTEMGGTSYVVFDSNQIKDVNNKQPTKKQDIRYSLKDVADVNEDVAELLRENTELQKIVGQLKGRMRAMNSHEVGYKSVRKLATDFKRKFSSKVDVNTLTENLKNAFDAMANADSDTEGKRAMEAMSSIALDMLQKSETVDREAYDDYRDMREYFRKGTIGLTGTQWAEAENLFGGKAAFRKALFGKWVAPVEGKANVTTLDMIWPELCQQYPAFFQEDASEGDMVSQVVAALDAVQIKRNGVDGDVSELAGEVATELYEAYLQMPELRSQDQKTISSLAGQLAEAREIMRNEMRSIPQRVRVEARERYNQQRVRREQNADWKATCAAISRRSTSLAKKLQAPKAGSFVPYQMRDAVTHLLEAIDFTKTRKATLDKAVLLAARDAYEATLTGSTITDGVEESNPLSTYYNADVVEALNQLAETAEGKTVNQLTLEEAKQLRTVVDSYSAMVINADNLFMEDRSVSLHKTGDELMGQMGERKEKMAPGKIRQVMDSSLGRGLLKPVTVFHKFSQTALSPVWNALRQAEGKHIRNVEVAEKYLGEALDQYGMRKEISKSLDKQRKEAAEFVTPAGQKVKLTVQERMTLLAAVRREMLTGTRHLVIGGFTLANKEAGTSQKTIRMCNFAENPEMSEAQREAEIRRQEKLMEKQLMATLTEQDIAYVDHMVDFLSTTCAEWGNEVTREMMGVERYTEKYYIPFSVDQNYVANDPASEQDKRLKMGSFTKALTEKARNPLEIKPFTELWCEHTEKMSDYNAFVMPIDDMTRMMNYKNSDGTVKSLMNMGYGRETTNYILQFLRRLNGNGRVEAGASWLNALMGKAKGAAVTFNASVAIQQMGAGVRAGSMIDSKYLLPGMAKGLKFWEINKKYAELAEHTPIAVEKSWGYFDTNMARGLFDRAKDTKWGHVEEAGGKAAEFGDMFNWVQIWEAVKLETKGKRADLKVGTDEYWQACSDRFTEIIDNTQVVDSVFQRAEWATEKGMMKNFMAFMSEPVTMYNMAYRAVYDLQEARVSGNKQALKAAGRKAARNVSAIMVSSMITAALKSVVTALRDRDNEKKDEEGNIVGVRGYGDKYWEAILPNFMENMMGLGTVYTNILTDALGNSYGTSNLITSSFDKFGGAIKEMSKGADADWTKVIYRLCGAASDMTGVGFAGLFRDALGMKNLIEETVNVDMLAGAAWDKSKTIQQRLAAAKANYVMAKQDGDSRKAKSAVYYDMLLDAYYATGLTGDFEAIAAAMIETGGTQTGITTGFKNRLRDVEPLVETGAQAYIAGDWDAYEEAVAGIVETEVGSKAAVSMIQSKAKMIQSEGVEKDPGTVEGMMEKLTEDGGELFKTSQVVQQAQSGDIEGAKKMVQTLRESGKDDKTIRQTVSTTYKPLYLEAMDKGDSKAAAEIRKTLLALDVGYTDESITQWRKDASGETFALAVEDGGVGALKSAVAEMKTAGYTDKQIRSKFVDKYKDAYVEAMAASSTRAAEDAKAKLKLGGVTDDEMAAWVKTAAKDGYEQAVKSGSATEIASAVKAMRASGMTDQQIRTKVADSYKRDYCLAVWSGKATEAARIGKLMTECGAGIGADDLEDWSDGNNVYTANGYGLYDLVRAGDGKAAVALRDYLYKSNSTGAVNKKLAAWASKYLKKCKTEEDKAKFRTGLYALGFSQQTVAKWE